MITAVIFAGGVKQIVLTPETQDEKFALSMIGGNDDIEVLVKQGSFGDKYNQPMSGNVSESQGGYLRMYRDEDSRILVLKPKAKTT